MRLAARIHQIRVERSLSLEDVAAGTGLAKSLIARVEQGQEVPTLKLLDTLAEVLGVPVHTFFYDDAEPAWTPRLSPRPTLKELTDEWHHQASPVRWSKPKRSHLTLIAGLSGWAARTPGRRQVHRKPLDPIVKPSA